MRLHHVHFIVGLVCVVPLAASAQDLSVGSNAPPVSVSSWVKGAPVERLDPARIYVVEFWATWCGPCRASIPHLTELQKTYKERGVTFLGVSVWEQDQDKVEPFVKEMGDKMDYSVALDEVAKGEKGNEGTMAKAWMKAADQEGIPTSFIVKDGKIAWIGHPMELDQPLEKVVSGNWNLETAARDYREQRVRDRKLGEIYPKVNQAIRSGKTKEALAVIDAAIAEDPALEVSLGMQKYQLLCESSRNDEASSYGNRLVETVFKGDASSLNVIAWTIVDPEGKLEPSKRDLKLALKAAELAHELTAGKDPMILDTLAKVQFDSGNPAKALELQEKAVKLMKEEDPEMKQRLEQYRKAAAEKGR